VPIRRTPSAWPTCQMLQFRSNIATSIMADAARPHGRISEDTADLITSIQNSALPAVSFGKPDGLLDGHPQSSRSILFESLVLNVLGALRRHSEVEGGNGRVSSPGERGRRYWDSGLHLASHRSAGSPD